MAISERGVERVLMVAHAEAAPAAQASGKQGDAEEQAVPVTGVVKHVLSQELLLYLDRVTALLQGTVSLSPRSCPASRHIAVKRSKIESHYVFSLRPIHMLACLQHQA